MVEGRFKVAGLLCEGNETGTYVRLEGVQGEPFGKYTPMARCEMRIINPGAEKQFELNAEYRVIFEKVEK